MKYLIWSIEHNAWWRPSEHGYTKTLTEAGLYKKEKAIRIVKRANISSFNECMVPEECAATGAGNLEVVRRAVSMFTPIIAVHGNDNSKAMLNELSALVDPQTTITRHPPDKPPLPPACPECGHPNSATWQGVRTCTKCGHEVACSTTSLAKIQE